MRSVELSTTDYANNEFVFEDIEDSWIGGGEESEVKLLSRCRLHCKANQHKKNISADTVTGTVPGEGGQ